MHKTKKKLIQIHRLRKSLISNQESRFSGYTETLHYFTKIAHLSLQWDILYWFKISATSVSYKVPLLISDLKSKYTSWTRLVSFLSFSSVSRAKHQCLNCVYKISLSIHEIASSRYKTVANKLACELVAC